MNEKGPKLVTISSCPKNQTEGGKKILKLGWKSLQMRTGIKEIKGLFFEKINRVDLQPGT